jgi:hypothetical protein
MLTFSSLQELSMGHLETGNQPWMAEVVDLLECSIGGPGGAISVLKGCCVHKVNKNGKMEILEMRERTCLCQSSI